jgi:hypothetical protein
MPSFTDDLEWARWFLSDAENRLVGRMASPCPEEDIAVLYHYISQAMPPYFEVGVLWGGSMVIAGLAMEHGHLYGIDPFHGYMAPGKVDPYVRHGEGKGLIPTREVAERNIAEYDLTDRTTLYTGFHPPLPRDLDETSFGCIFIDGDHQTKSVLADWNTLKYHASNIVIFHDLHHSTIKPAWAKIKQDPMVEEVLFEGGRGLFSRMGVVKVRQE